MVKKFVFFMLFLTVSDRIAAFGVGIIVGSRIPVSESFLGIVCESGVLVPLVKLEIEGGQLIASSGKFVSMAVQIRPRFGIFSPYIGIGFGTGFGRINYPSEFKQFSLLAFGGHMFLQDNMSLRLDCKLIHNSSANFTRVSGGLFVHF